jgi:hypothetical protein
LTAQVLAVADKELVERFIVPGGDPKRLGTWLLVEPPNRGLK